MGKKPDSLDITNTYKSAVSLHQQGKFSRAVNLYTKILAHLPDVAEIHYNLGLALYELEQFADAIAAYRNACKLNPQDGDIFYNLGLACKMNKQYDEAEKAYLHALELCDDDQDILYNLGCCYQDAGFIDQACLVFERLLQTVPRHLPATNNLAYLYHLQSNFDHARKLYGKVLELDPGSQSAQFMYAILSGEKEQAPPQEYVRELFDQYSENFEENLTKNLEYNTYCILRQSIEGLAGKKSRYENSLDLGCGTGLAGEAFHSACIKLTGVDLSENMLKQASRKQLYNYLHREDAVTFLQQTSQKYDLIIAADVLPYIGTLTSLFAGTSRCATKDALFCLSSEETEKPGWELRLTGRYAHNPQYITGTAAKYGWIVLEQFQANIRKENNAWIKGTIFVLGRKT